MPLDDDDISPCAGDYGLDLCLLDLGHGELVKGLLEIVEKGLPLGRSDHQMLVRVLHARHRLSAWDARFFDLSASFVARGDWEATLVIPPRDSRSM